MIVKYSTEQINDSVDNLESLFEMFKNPTLNSIHKTLILRSTFQEIKINGTIEKRSKGSNE